MNYLHSQPLRHQLGISFKIEQALNEIGINKMQELIDTGAHKAFLRLKARNPSLRLSILYALHGAIEGQYWYEYSSEEKNSIKFALEQNCFPI